MLRYRLAALALKAFSLNAITRSAYRKLGNLLGSRNKSHKFSPYFIGSANAKLALMERNGAVADGMRLLELGTGWMHYDAIYTRLFHRVEIVLFDVWDARQFGLFRSYLDALLAVLPQIEGRAPEQLAEALALVRRLQRCASFDEVYALLGFTYLVDADGRLDALADSSIDTVFNSDVMEHIPEHTMERLAQDLRRVVKPDGHVAMQICTHDHLTIYDGAVHLKNYLRYTDRQWQRWFDNTLQYMNRWQHVDFQRFFSRQGFTLIADEIVTRVSLAGFPIAERWRDYTPEQLEARTTRLLIQNSKD